MCYRTCRALAAMRGLLSSGQAIAEACTFQDVLSSQKPFMNSQIASLDGMEAPIVPQPGMTKQELDNVSTLHVLTAFEIGIDPDSPLLHWLSSDMLLEFFPTENSLLDYEHLLLGELGAVLLAKGSLQSLRRAESIVGNLSRHEKRDFTALPYSWVKAMQRVDTDDARALQVLRLEKMAGKARAALDLRAELAALRESASIQGLRFQTESNEQRELIATYSIPRKRPQLLE
jgi:hypothetical protein